VRTKESTSLDFQLHWRKLQQVGLNAYEARSYLVLMGHPRFKALELAARAHVPRQKIYEVLDSLVEKGFAQVVQEKTKLFSAIDPNLAIPGYLARRTKTMQNELHEQSRLATGLMEDLRAAYEEGQGGRGTLDYLNLVNDPTQTALHYRRMLANVSHNYSEFSRPPFAVDPLDERLVKEAAARGINCRLLIEAGPIDPEHQDRLNEYRDYGIEIRFLHRLPLKLALFDRRCGLVALLDPVLTKPSWTALVFEHEGFAEAMSGLFESYWCRAEGTAPLILPPLLDHSASAAKPDS
jgi:HTH-type transcriptional regulator, sugar sensing transcriptional regulator